jgi:manganese transport protein
MISKIRNIGPGALVTAAFIGPGTVTACTVAGASFGYALLWSLVFVTFATILLQEMSARLGVVTQRGLGETLAFLLQNSFLKWPLFALVGVALYLGNAAYEGGNLSGAALGIQAVFGEREEIYDWSVLSISVLAAGLLLAGTYKQVEKTLIGLVILMALAFVATFTIVGPDSGALVRGLVVPAIPEGSLMTVIALIGTTVVPYNLFLHASTAKARWKDVGDLGAARSDTTLAIGLGGIITILIVSTAAASMFSAGLTVANASDMARQFEPLFGPFSRYLLGVGFFAAGLSSAITAPLATSYAMTEILQLKRDQSSWPFRIVFLSVILCGMSLALAGINPVVIILSAQFANGLLLPIIASFLLYAMNQRQLLGVHVNGAIANTLGAGVLILTAGLGLRLVLRTFGVM